MFEGPIRSKRVQNGLHCPTLSRNPCNPLTNWTSSLAGQGASLRVRMTCGPPCKALFPPIAPALPWLPLPLPQARPSPIPSRCPCPSTHFLSMPHTFSSFPRMSIRKLASLTGFTPLLAYALDPFPICVGLWSFSTFPQYGGTWGFAQSIGSNGFLRQKPLGRINQRTLC